MIRLHKKNKQAMFAAALLTACAMPASAIQVLDATEGATLYAKVSQKDMTRLAVHPGRIASLRVREGELGIDPEEETGQLYLVVPPGSKKPVSAFLTTEAGQSYTLILQPTDIPADSIVIRAPVAQKAAARADHKATSYDKTVKRLILAMANDELPRDVEVKEIGRRVELWKEASMTLEREYATGDVVGERYQVANVSAAPMVLDEREFYRKGVSVVALDHLTLAPGASTRLYVIREKAQHE